MEWINVKDELPKESKSYWCYDQMKKQFVAVFDGGAFVTIDYEIPCYKITHWMPLPEPPKPEPERWLVIRYHKPSGLVTHNTVPETIFRSENEAMDFIKKDIASSIGLENEIHYTIVKVSP